MMIQTKLPYGSINERILNYKYKQNGKFFIVDISCNRYEVEEEDYHKAFIREKVLWD